MNKTSAILLLLFVTTSMQAQQWISDSLPAAGIEDSELIPGTPPKRLQTHVMIWTSQTYDANFTKAIIYLEGSYRLTDKLTISGAGFKEFPITGNSPIYNPYTRNSPHDGIYLNADYEISEGVHIQAGFGYTRGYSPYMRSPMYDPYPFSGRSIFPAPFQNNSFETMPLH